MLSLISLPCLSKKILNVSKKMHIELRKIDIINITREDKAKLFGYLTRRGFQIDLINGVINEIVNK